MFGLGKNNKNGKKPGGSKKPSREALIAQARANAAKARAELGDETIQKIAAAMQKKDQSPAEQAKEKIRQMDKGRVADHIKSMIDDE